MCLKTIRPMSGPYYNTTHIRGQLLVEYTIKAAFQEDKVAEFARANPWVEFSCEDIGRLVLPGTPRTSWGRACTNLEHGGILQRLDKKITGSWGRPIYLYRLAWRDPEQKDLFG